MKPRSISMLSMRKREAVFGEAREIPQRRRQNTSGGNSRDHSLRGFQE
jgi:hypothetical protein